MTTITLPRAVVEQALEAMRCAVPTGKITLYEWDKALSDLADALARIEWVEPLAQQAEPVEPVATVTECEACFTPDVCQLRGTCDYYTASQMRIAAPPQQAEPVLQTCNCRWDGEVQVQQCTLHEAHVDAIHEWAERAKVAERKLAQQAEPACPDCHGIGYDASGQLCACQENPSF